MARAEAVSRACVVMRWGQGVGAGDGVLVGVWTSGSADGAEASLAELTGLAKTASALVYDVTKRRQQPDPATYIQIGRGRRTAGDRRCSVAASRGGDRRRGAVR